MIESIYSSRSLIKEIQQSPYCEFVEKFVFEHYSEGYSFPTIKTKLIIIIKLIRWLAYKSITPNKIKRRYIDEFKDDFTSEVARVKTGTWLSLTRFLYLVENKHNVSLTDKKIKRFYGDKKILAEAQIFETYMRHDKGLTETSIVRFKTTVQQFLVFTFSKENFKTHKIEASDILSFLQERGKHFCDRTLRTDGSALRCYLKFIYGKEKIKSDLSHAVPQFSVWRNQNVIHTISEDEMSQLLHSCDLDDPIGVRDYAILLCLMRYGLRPIELVNLKLDDIYWDKKQILVSGKGKTTSLPLEDDVGAALNRYLKVARPNSVDQEVFIRGKAPHIRFTTSGAISSVVRHALDRCNLSPSISGARLLRYSVASKILNKGGTLQEVSQLLRHTSINTSVLYTRLDMNRLKQVPLEWPTNWERYS